nr:reverse transcriptase domain-containing protein [Tanacetum cinerariifolium]
EITQEVLNVAAGGIFLYKTPNQAYQLLKDKVLLELDWAKNQKTRSSLKKTIAFADEVIRVKQKQLSLGVGTERMIIDFTMKRSYSNGDTCFSIDVIDEILEEDFDALLDEGSKILHSIEGTLLEEEIFAEFDKFMAMTADENSNFKYDTEEQPFEKITINTNYKIKTSLEEPPTDLELKLLLDNQEYVFLEEPYFLPVIISSQLSKEKKNKLDRKGTENVAADHLSRIRNNKSSDDSEVDDNFPRETLMEINTKDEPWFVDFKNYLSGDVIPKEMMYQQKNKFFSDLKHYFWEEPYFFKVCSDGMIRRCVSEPETQTILDQCHHGPTDGHYGPNRTAKKVLDSGFYWPTIIKEAHTLVCLCETFQKKGNISKRDEMPLNNIQAEAQALPTNDARVVVTFLKRLFCHFGMPKALISDRGSLEYIPRLDTSKSNNYALRNTSFKKDHQSSPGFRMDFAKPVKAIYLLQDVLSTSVRHLIELENQVQCLMEAHLAPMQPIQVNKITPSCEICSGLHDTQYCMENPKQAFVEICILAYQRSGRTINVVSRHTEHHLAKLKNPNFNAIYNLYRFAWAFKANMIPHGLAWSKVTTSEKSDYKELFGPMSNLNVALISSPKEMSQASFKDSAEFIKGLDAQDGTFLQDDQVDDGDGVLDSQLDDGDGVLDSQTKDIIEEASMLPTVSSNNPQAGNAAVSEFFAEFDALKKEILLIKKHKDDEFDELTKRFSNDYNLKKSDGGVSIEEKPKFSSHHNDSSNHIGGVSSEVDSYDDDYMSLFNDEEQPDKSSLNDLELQQEQDIVDVKDGISKQQANDDKGQTTVIQENVGVTVKEQHSLGRGLGTLKFKKNNYERAFRPNYVLRSAKIRKKKMAMSLKSPFGQQSDTIPIPTKRKTRLNKTEDIVLPFDLEKAQNHLSRPNPSLKS